MNLVEYNAFFKAVQNFNTAIGVDKTHVRDPKSIALYKSLTLEEIEETIEALICQEEADFLDGVFDVFVTASYHNYLHTGISSAAHFTSSKVTEVTRLALLEKMKYQVDELFVGHFDIMKLIRMAEQRHGYENVINLFVDGIASNNSKFIFDTSKKNRDKELAYITEKYEGTTFTNAKLVKSKFGDTPIYVARSNFGEGKLLKPSSFIPLDASRYVRR